MSPRVLKTETHFKGRAFTIRTDEVEYQPGRSHRMEIVEHTGAVTVLPLDAENNLWLVQQYRHATGGELLELPAGTLEPGEDALLGADRELQEEIGMKAGKLEKLLSFFLAPGYSTEEMHVYLGTELTPSKLEQDDDEVIHVEKVPLKRALDMAANGEFRDSKTLVSLLVAARRFGW